MFKLQQGERLPFFPLVAYISAVGMSQRGDLLCTGTLRDVGFARRPPVFVKHGDVTEVEIEKLGVLRRDSAAEL